ncbi:hypothetical protein BK026_13655 [Alteromonas sp. V450]|uniref:hypothetical protein n=1 Tax=Alteromonas sp. V450 TaxID=1912139 RepID=UPI0008FF1FDC|nr:hypothetical protein [Alteromonas sp. V450]OJF69739.1 hypothetical protein BK026_13655 [Alteromonas sp. V450]|tara:strand:+ start:971 stop:2647 length:1677 start_codon:yes stop_codon:yes gene_type:complete
MRDCYRLTISLVFASLITACGGGGGDSDPGQPSGPSTPPDPARVPPTLVYTVNKTAVFEGEEIVFDMSDSTSGSSGSREILIEQVSGTPATRLSDINSEAFRYLAPEYDQDIEENLRFQLTVRNGNQDTDSELVEILVKGVSGAGTAVAQYTPAIDLIVGNGNSVNGLGGGLNAQYVIGAQTINDGTTDSVQLQAFGITDTNQFSDFEDNTTITFGETYPSITYLETEALAFTLLNTFVDEIAVLSETANKYWWVTKKDINQTGTQAGEFSADDSIDIDAPCFSRGRTSTGINFIWVGQRDIGFSTVELEPIEGDGRVVGFNDTVVPQLQNGRSLCFLYPTELAESLVEDDPFTPRIPDLIGIDYNSAEIVLIADTDLDGTYEEIDSFNFIENQPANMKILDVIPVGTPSQVPRSLFVLLTDGEHIGNHALVQLNQEESTGEIHLVPYTWTEGVPVALLHGNFGGVEVLNQYIEDLVVVRQTSGTSLFFDNITDRASNTTAIDIFADPVEFELDAGAGSAVKVWGANNAAEAILVSYPDTGIIKLYNLTEIYERLYNY